MLCLGGHQRMSISLGLLSAKSFFFLQVGTRKTRCVHLMQSLALQWGGPSYLRCTFQVVRYGIVYRYCSKVYKYLMEDDMLNLVGLFYESHLTLHEFVPCFTTQFSCKVIVHCKVTSKFS
ncbi:hypothetical protein M758_3G057100 [Ceratodon purpureus]|nr:hypothetical protein M758_3G057100 [Ceratodon purpureus]